MSNRLSHFIVKENEKKLKKFKDQALLKSRKEVDINANGSGYTIKHGADRGKMLKQIIIKGKNI